MLNSALSVILICILSLLGAVEYGGEYRGQTYFVTSSLDRSWQLGGLIVVTREESLAHEQGHFLQERQLGQYYLPIAGLGSLLASIQSIYRSRRGLTNLYYAFPTERWADELGGVKRE